MENTPVVGFASIKVVTKGGKFVSKPTYLHRLPVGESEDSIDINKIENTYKYLLVSSDGLHGYVEKKVISDIVHDSSLSLQEKTETLIARVNQSGGYDNCTVILMENDGE